MQNDATMELVCHVLRSSDVDRLDRLDDRSPRVRQSFDHRRRVKHRVDALAGSKHVRVMANVALEPAHSALGFRRRCGVEDVHRAPFGAQCGDEVASQISRTARDEAALLIER
jgi:hypothetical protein